MRDDAFIIEAKNRLLAENSSHPPKRDASGNKELSSILLPLYEFERAETGEVTDDVNPGPQQHPPQLPLHPVPARGHRPRCEANFPP